MASTILQVGIVLLAAHIYQCAVPNDVTPCYGQKISGTYLEFPLKIIKNAELHECQRYCFTSSAVCKSISYDIANKVCYLNKETIESKSGWVRYDAGYAYWRRHESCDFNCHFIHNRKTYIQGYVLAQYNTYSHLQCMEACYQDKRCKSYNYEKQTRKCTLHTESKLSFPNAYKGSESWENYHKVCQVHEKEYSCFESHKNYYLNDLNRPYSGKTEQECVKLCLYGTIPCSSVSYNKKAKICYVSRRTKESHSSLYKPSNDYVYFHRQSECQNDCVIKPFPDYYINNHNIKSYSTRDEMHCVEKCLTEQPKGICKSVSYHRQSKTCYLHDESRITAPSQFSKNENYNHWHISCEDYDCFSEYPFNYLNNQHYKIIADATEYNCKAACLKTQECKSVNYDSSLKKCYLSKETKETKFDSYKKNPLMVYWQRKAICKPNCHLMEYDNFYITGQYKKTIKSYSSLECKQLCLTEKSFDCKSVSYNKKTHLCYLSIENHKSNSKLWKAHNDYIFWEKKCIKIYPCFARDHQRYLQDVHYETYNGISEEDCVYKCEISLCKSVNYNFKTQTCYLNNDVKAKIPNRYRGDADYDYFEKKEICKPNCYYKKYENKYLNGFNNVQKQVKSEKECLRLCLNARSWCKSVDYNKLSRNCYLSAHAQINGIGLSASFIYNYYELTCEEKHKEYPCFTMEKNKVVEGFTSRILQGQTEFSCMKECILATFNCLSAEYSPKTKTCLLSKESKHTKPSAYKNHESYNYYHRKPSCLRKCTRATLHNKMLDVIPLDIFIAKDDYSCIMKCFLTKQCVAAQINRKTRQCYLISESKYGHSPAFKINQFYTHWRLC